MPDLKYNGMQEHIDRLDEKGLLVRVDREINKDTEMHPLVRWQYRGGISEEERKAFLFTNVTDSNGREFDTPVIVGGLAANPAIYATGMNASPEDIPATWEYAIENPVEPEEVRSDDAPIHDVVHEGDELKESGNGLEGIPVPISTPGFDNAPYTTMSAGITHDPDSDIRNFGMYRAQIKSSIRTGVFSVPGHGVYEHWMEAQERGERLPMALCVGAPPVVAYAGAQSLPMDMDELAVAGGLVDAPIREVEAKTIPVMVPADADIIIEGHLRPDILEPEGQFGESHGHMSLPAYNMVFEVSAITRRNDAVFTSIISQLTPSESCTLKKVAMEPLYLNYLRETCKLTNVTNVHLHEPMTNLRKVIFVQLSEDADQTEVWRALYATASFRSAHGKIIVAIDEDIDPNNLDSVFWAMSYRSNPVEDTEFLEGRNIGHHPNERSSGINDSAVLWDATQKEPFPPLALPKQEYMEQAREIWEDLELGELDSESPWYGYSLGVWTDRHERDAQRAVKGDYFQTGEDLKDERVSPDDVTPNKRVDY